MSARLSAGEITDAELAALYVRVERAEAMVAAVRELVNLLGGPNHRTLLKVLDAPDPTEALRALWGGYLPYAPDDRPKRRGWAA